ncbi:hypothetical protein BUALT_Bualt07G0059700 [Buddleja alternifolia]|uniref:Pectinesterase inhibitor domain-containing protein n=1 Tax=Buddleja alternifolia TaxID=168488 RepID=A0AAV6X9X1_9LAMI|nr:hypothetical protein BUALT_Bualt07G0059700 [Buddleja alternifolia]
MICQDLFIDSLSQLNKSMIMTMDFVSPKDKILDNEEIVENLRILMINAMYDVDKCLKGLEETRKEWRFLKNQIESRIYSAKVYMLNSLDILDNKNVIHEIFYPRVGSIMAAECYMLSFDVYLSSSSRYYCHLTTYPELCYDSISSIVNATILKSKPGPIFSASIKVSINELNNTTIFITKALYTSKTNDSLVGLRLYKCRTWANDSLSRLNESLSILGVDSDIDSLTYEEMDNMKALMMAAMRDAIKCLLALDEIDAMVVESEEKIMGVEEVKLGMEKARKCMVNSIELLDGSETVLSDFYNPFIENDDYNDHSYYDFDYREELSAVLNKAVGDDDDVAVVEKKTVNEVSSEVTIMICSSSMSNKGRRAKKDGRGRTAFNPKTKVHYDGEGGTSKRLSNKILICYRFPDSIEGSRKRMNLL